MASDDIFRNLALTPSALTVLNALKSGRGLSNLLALTTLGVGSLSSRIAELRAAGHTIHAEMNTGTSGKRYAVYRLDGAPMKKLSPQPRHL